MMTMTTVKMNPIFRELLKCDKRYLVLKGSAGSGKSFFVAQRYILRLMKDKGRNLLAMRKSEVTNRDSTFAELSSSIYKMGLQDFWTITTSPLKLECINGNSIIFRGMNDQKQREKLKSITFTQGKLTDVWLEEATEFSQDDLEIIDDRLRGELDDGLFYQIVLTFNPVSANHWLKKLFFDRQDENVKTHSSTYRDNKFIDAGYYERMERRKETDPEGYRIYGEGEWGETGGLILENWKRSDLSTFKLEDFDGLAIGQDFGFNHANALLLLGWKDSNVYVLREIYEHEKDTEDLINIANTKFHDVKDVTMFCDSAEPDRIRQWRKNGWNASGVVKSSGSKSSSYIQSQIDWLKQRKIFIDYSCENLIKELELWKWERDRVSGEYTDRPQDFNDDAIAALRYGVERWRGANKSASLKLGGRRIGL